MKYLLGTGSPLILAAVLSAADIRTDNFIVSAKTEPLAKEIGKRAEELRVSKAVLWTGKELPPWITPLPVEIDVDDRSSASGATTLNFDFRGGVLMQRMKARGSYDRILKDVLPHEITHAVLGTELKRPVPRWADEGTASLGESEQAQSIYRMLILRGIRENRAMSLYNLMTAVEYPSTEVILFYAQGYSVTRLLVEKGGKEGHRKFTAFLKTANHGNWEAAVRDHYGYPSLVLLQDEWVKTIFAEEAKKEAENRKRTVSFSDGSVPIMPLAK